MTKTARRHHYLPQFYLAGFTPSGRRKDCLYVVDVKNCSIRKSKPLNLANQRDYYRVGVEGYDPTFIEKHFSFTETTFAPIVAEIRETAKIPTGTKFTDLMLFFSQLYVRTPKARTFFKRSHHQLADFYVKMTLSDRAHWERMIEQLRESGEEIPEGISLDDIRKSYESGDLRIVENQDHELAGMLLLTTDLFPFFYKRHWSILLRPNGYPHFVVADSPIVPTFNAPQSLGTPPGLALEEVDLIVPLSKDIAALGTWTNTPSLIPATQEVITKCNANSVAWADRFVFCTDESEMCCLLDGKQGQIMDLAKQLLEKRKRSN